MNYFIEMNLADSARLKSPQDGVAFIEGFVLPSLEIMAKWQKEGQVLAGGPSRAQLHLLSLLRPSQYKSWTNSVRVCLSGR